MATNEEFEKAAQELTRFILNDVFAKYDFTPEQTLVIVKSVLLAFLATVEEWGELGNGVS